MLGLIVTVFLGQPSLAPGGRPAPLPGSLTTATPDARLWHAEWPAFGLSQVDGETLVLDPTQCRVLLVDPKSGALRKPAQPIPLFRNTCDAELVGDAVVLGPNVYDAHTGALRFERDPDSTLIAARKLWVSMQTKQLRGLDPKDGHPVWSHPLENTAGTRFAGIDLIADAETVYVRTQPQTGVDVRITAWPLDGKPARWQRVFPLANGPSSFRIAMGLTGPRLAIVAEGKLQLLATATGKTQVSFSVWGDGIGDLEDLAVGEGLAVVAQSTTEGPRIAAYDLGTGELRWKQPRHEHDEGLRTRLAIVKDRVLWVPGPVLLAYDAQTGREQWRFGISPEPLVSIWKVGDQVWLAGWPDGTFAFDPKRAVPDHTVKLTGRVRVTADPMVTGADLRDLSGIAITVGEWRAVSDAQGRFELSVRGAGRVWATTNTYAVVERQKHLKVPKGHFACPDEASFEVDLEQAKPPAELAVAITLEACGIR